jgi:hypothetical protein
MIGCGELNGLIHKVTLRRDYLGLLEFALSMMDEIGPRDLGSRVMVDIML